MTKLTSIFKGRRQRAFDELIRKFKGEKLEFKPYLNDKQRLMADALLGMNVKAKQIKKVKKRMAAKVLIYFVHNQKQNHVINTLVSLSKKMLSEVVLIQRKRRQNVSLHQFISMKMLDGICEQLKDEDFREKQKRTTPLETTEISYYINYLRKKDKAEIVKSFLKIVKELFKRHLMLSTGRMLPITEEDQKFMDIETKNMKKQLSEILDIHQKNNRDQVEEIIEAVDEADEVQQEKQKKEKEKEEKKKNGDEEDETVQSVQPQRKRNQLKSSDYDLLEVLRNTQVKIRIIQSRSIMRGLILERLNEIKIEKDEALSELYLTQQKQQN